MAHGLRQRATDMAETDLSSPSLFDLALTRLKQGGAAVSGTVLAGSMVLQLPAIAGCVEDPSVGTTEQADWAQFEGQRNTDMVAFTGGYWTECKNPNTRFGCGSIDMVVSVRVRPVQGASLDWKRVGVVFKSPYDSNERTAIGTYNTTWSNGDEEWFVRVNVPTWQTTITFNAWYQDGAGHTYFDDNNGELHVINDGPAYQIIRVEPWMNTVTVGDAGVQGRISVQVTDLDYDKEIEIIATKDGWNSVIELGIGAAGEKNRWYWAEEFPWAPGRERWQIDLDLPGPADVFEYAVVYRHGVKNNARTYEFWDNNFNANYRIERTPDVD